MRLRDFVYIYVYMFAMLCYSNCREFALYVFPPCPLSPTPFIPTILWVFVRKKGRAIKSLLYRVCISNNATWPCRIQREPLGIYTSFPPIFQQSFICHVLLLNRKPKDVLFFGPVTSPHLLQLFRLFYKLPSFNGIRWFWISFYWIRIYFMMIVWFLFIYFFLIFHLMRTIISNIITKFIGIIYYWYFQLVLPRIIWYQGLLVVTRFIGFKNHQYQEK